MRLSTIPWLSLAVLAALAPPAAAQGPAGRDAPPPGVVVETAAVRDVAERRHFTGRVEAIDKVDLMARVQGFLAARAVEEGAEVEPGRLLFEIEKPPYQAAVSEAEANLARAEAAVELARVSYRRVEVLGELNAASRAQGDEARAQLLESQAGVKAATAALTRARIDLGYTEVRAPMAGRIGRAAYSVGDLVGPGGGPLATLVAQDPMYVAFPVPSRVLLAVRRERRQRESVVVYVELPDGSTYEHPGAVRFVEVESNATTDTVTVRATVPNPDRLLVDRQLVGVTVEAKQPEAKLLVSQSALLLDREGAYVLVVDSEDRVEVRRVKVGEQRGPRVEVASGLAAGERVVVGGHQKIRPGMRVAPRESVEDEPAPGAAGRQ